MNRILISGPPGLLIFILAAFSDPHESLQNTPRNVTDPSPLDFPIKGITVLYNAEDSPQIFRKDVVIAKTLGAKWIQIQVAYYTRDERSAGFPVFDRRTPTPTQLTKAIDFVVEQGCKVAIHPILLIQDENSIYWRGEYSPTALDCWWRDYSVWMRDLAQVCTRARVPLLIIGSELTSLQNKTALWTALIDQLRIVYSGGLGYSSNWDSWQSIRFHEKLDLVGINGYFPLIERNAPINRAHSQTEYEARLLPHLSALNLWKQSHQTPMIFTEVGYPANGPDLSRPWRHSNKPTTMTEGDQQLAGFRSFMNVFGQAGPQQGIFFYALHGHDPSSNSGYTPVNKRTQSIWSKYLQEEHTK